METSSHTFLSSSLSPARGLRGWKAVCSTEEVKIRGGGYLGPRLGVAGTLCSTAPSSKFGVDDTWEKDFRMESGLLTPPSS